MACAPLPSLRSPSVDYEETRFAVLDETRLAPWTAPPAPRRPALRAFVMCAAASALMAAGLAQREPPATTRGQPADTKVERTERATERTIARVTAIPARRERHTAASSSPAGAPSAAVIDDEITESMRALAKAKTETTLP